MEHLQAVLSCFTPLVAYSCFLKCGTVYSHWKHTILRTILYTWSFFREECTTQVTVGKTEYMTQEALNRGHATLCRGAQTNPEQDSTYTPDLVWSESHTTAGLLLILNHTSKVSLKPHWKACYSDTSRKDQKPLEQSLSGIFLCS